MEIKELFSTYWEVTAAAFAVFAAYVGGMVTIKNDTRNMKNTIAEHVKNTKLNFDSNEKLSKAGFDGINTRLDKVNGRLDKNEKLIADVADKTRDDLKEYADKADGRMQEHGERLASLEATSH